MDGPDALRLELPGDGWWQARNSPARRVPSHGTALFGSSHALDLIGVDERGRSGPIGWRTLLATEDPQRFVGFGRPVTAPVAGVIASVHDGEPDVRVHRSPVAYLPFALTQPQRARRRLVGLAGNCVVIAPSSGGFAVIAHLMRGSVTVETGEWVPVGQPIGRVGNSGNSIQPHVHLQVSDTVDSRAARGLPFVLTGFRGRDGSIRRDALPREGETIRRV